MKIVVTERDRYNVQKFCWEQVKRLPISRRDRKLLAAQLELDWWRRWRTEHKEED